MKRAQVHGLVETLISRWGRIIDEVAVLLKLLSLNQAEPLLVVRVASGSLSGFRTFFRCIFHEQLSTGRTGCGTVAALAYLHRKFVDERALTTFRPPRGVLTRACHAEYNLSCRRLLG